MGPERPWEVMGSAPSNGQKIMMCLLIYNILNLLWIISLYSPEHANNNTKDGIVCPYDLSTILIDHINYYSKLLLGFLPNRNETIELIIWVINFFDILGDGQDFDYLCQRNS